MNESRNKLHLICLCKHKKITFRLDRSYKPFTINNFVMIICMSLYFNASVWTDLGVTSEVFWSLEITVMSIDICPTNGNNFSALFLVQGDLSKACCLFQRKTTASIKTALLRFNLLANQKKWLLRIHGALWPFKMNSKFLLPPRMQ